MFPAILPKGFLMSYDFGITQQLLELDEALLNTCEFIKHLFMSLE